MGRIYENETITIGIDGFTTTRGTSFALDLTSCITHQRYYIDRSGSETDSANGYSKCRRMETLENIGKGDYRNSGDLEDRNMSQQVVFTALWKDALPGGAFGGEKIVLTAVTDLEMGTYFAEFPASNRIRLPSAGLLRNSPTLSSNARTFGPVIDANPKSDPVGVFTHLSMSFNPREAGALTAVTFEFTLGPGDITSGGSIVR